jgi:hypothetical protein
MTILTREPSKFFARFFWCGGAGGGFAFLLAFLGKHGGWTW